MSAQAIETFAEIGIPVNPFPGLRPFDFNESHLFFGRDGQSEQLIAKLARTHFLAVVGTSGSGKSSLVRAGLLPVLHGGFMTTARSNWRIAVMRPGNDPIGNLARALNERDVFGSEVEENASLQTALAEAALRRGGRGLVDAVRQAMMPDNENLLVLVDQFEEIFRFARVAEGEEYQNEAAAFVKLILEASRQREIPIYVVLTMRSDYLGDCSQFWDLPEAINESQYLIPRLTRDQLREAITGPIAVAKGAITPRLVARLLNDVGEDQDQLPVLQHLLMRVWNECREKLLDVEVEMAGKTVTKSHRKVHQGEEIDLCCYEAVGGMAEALSRHADEAFNELPDDRSREVAEKLFKCLTEKGEDNREIRRPITLGEICALTGATAAAVTAVIDVFRHPGRSFLMPPACVDLKPESLIDISHESLIRRWSRLREWVNEEARSARTYQRLADTAALYKAGEEGYLRDPGLQVALDWKEQNKPNDAWARRYNPNFEEAMAFLEASRAARANEARQKQEQRRKQVKRARLLALVFAALFLLALGAGAVAWARTAEVKTALREVERQSREVVKQKDIADQNARTARIAEAQALSDKAVAEGRKKEAEVAKKAAEEQKQIALKQTEVAKRQTQLAQTAAEKLTASLDDAKKQRDRAEEALAVVKSQDHAPAYIRAVMRGSKDSVVNALFTNQGKVITAGFDGKARLWDLGSEAEIDALQDEGMGNVLTAIASGNGDRAATVSDDRGAQNRKGTEKVVRIWYRSAGRVLPMQFGDSTPKVFFLHDDKDLVSWNEHNLNLWDVATRQSKPLAFKPEARGAPVLNIAATRDGSLWTILGTRPEVQAAANSELRIVNASDGRETRMQIGKETRTALFSGDASMIVAIHTDKSATIWSAAGKKITSIQSERNLSRAIFSPNNRRLLTIDDEKTATIWDVKTLKKTVLPNKVLSEAFSPDSRYVVTAGLDNSAALWDADTGELLREFRGHTSPVTSVAFSPDGQFIVTAGDKTARVWEAAIGFDFVKHAPDAEWVTAAPSGAATKLHFNDSDADSNGFVCYREGYRMEDGSVPSGQLLETHPKWVDDGVISGRFPSYLVGPGDHFKANLGFLLGGQAGNVEFQLNYEEDGKLKPVKSWMKAYTGKLMPVDVDLSELVGHRVRFVLAVLANGTSAQDWATWINPRIVPKESVIVQNKNAL